MFLSFVFVSIVSYRKTMFLLIKTIAPVIPRQRGISWCGTRGMFSSYGVALPDPSLPRDDKRSLDYLIMGLIVCNISSDR